MLDFITLERILIFVGGLLFGFITQQLRKNKLNSQEDYFEDELGDKMAVIEELRNYISRLERGNQPKQKSITKNKKNYKFKKVVSSKDPLNKPRKRKPTIN